MMKLFRLLEIQGEEELVSGCTDQTRITIRPFEEEKPRIRPKISKSDRIRNFALRFIFKIFFQY